MYLTYEHYVTEFGGRIVPEEEFDALSEATTTIIDLLVHTPITEVSSTIRRAAFYQIELLFAQGGNDALSGLATVTSGIDEKLGDYSIGTPYVANDKRCYSIGGVPVSGLTLMILRKEGLMCRCVYGVNIDE